MASPVVNMIGPDGSLAKMSQQDADSAIKSGAPIKYALQVQAPDGSKAWVPHDSIGDVLKNKLKIVSQARDQSVPTQFEQERSGGKGFLGTLGSDLIGMLKPSAQNPYPGMGQEAKAAAAVQSGQEDSSRQAAGYNPAYRALAPVGEAVGLNVPGMEQAAAQGNTSAVLGHAAAPVVAYGAAKGASAAVDAFPRYSRAGDALSQVKSVVGDMPVNTGPAGDVALNISDLAGRGGSMPKVVRDFLRRTTTPEAGPLTYSEARDFYSNATRLSVDEFNRLTPVMQRQVAEFTKALGRSIGETAAEGGVGAEYSAGMKEYAAASRMKNRGALAAKIAQKAIPAAAAGYVAKKIIDGR